MPICTDNESKVKYTKMKYCRCKYVETREVK